MRYPVIVEAEEEGGFHVWCPALKGCHSQGETQAEALENIREAVPPTWRAYRPTADLPADVTIHYVEAAAYQVTLR